MNSGCDEKPASKRRWSATVVSLSILVLLVIWVVFAPTKIDRDSYLEICTDKHRILRETPSPKVILIGGSNLALGLDSALLKNLLKRPVVNMGTCIQVGLGYMLREIEADVNDGDIVVVIPEYEHWVDQFNGDKYLLMLPAIMPQSVAWLTPSYLNSTLSVSRITGDFSWMTHKRSRHILPPPLTGVASDDDAVLYNYSGFNRLGDFVAHLDLPGKSFDNSQASLADFSHPNPAAIQAFNSITKQMQARGAKIVLLPPVTTASFVRHRKLQLDSFYKEVSACLNAQVVDDYAGYALADKYFFDCIYHVRKEGRKLRTEQVAADLNRILQANSRPSGRVM